MSKVREQFSINDLETLSGIKAHTIRIWEKRYDVLNPSRSGGQVRTYCIKDLQKLLNISVLYKQGVKISAISKLSNEELDEVVRKSTPDKQQESNYINRVVMSMYNLDRQMFEEAFREEMAYRSFFEVFTETYIPVLHYIGILWQTNAIHPIHEQFISSLVREKIILQTALTEKPNSPDSALFVLFLPEGEMHEIGLLFLNYFLKSKGRSTIYLGESIPFDNLFFLKDKFDEMTLVSAAIIDKEEAEKTLFVDQMSQLIAGTKHESWIIGRIWEQQKQNNQSERLKFFKGFEEIIERI